MVMTTLTTVEGVFFLEKSNVASVARKLVLLDAHVAARRTRVTGELNASRANYLARVTVKRRRARFGATQSTAEAWIASNLVDAVTYSAPDDRRRAVREGKDEARSAAARREVSLLESVPPLWAVSFCWTGAKRRKTEGGFYFRQAESGSPG